MSPDNDMGATHDDPTTELGVRLAHALKVRGRSPYWLQKNANLAGGYVYRVLTGEMSDLGADMFERMADALNVSYEWLARGDGPMERTGGVRAVPPPAPSIEAPDAYATVEGTALFQGAHKDVQEAFRRRSLKLPPNPHRAIRRATEHLLQLITQHEDGLLAPSTPEIDEFSSEIREVRPKERSVGGSRGQR